MKYSRKTKDSHPAIPLPVVPMPLAIGNLEVKYVESIDVPSIDMIPPPKPIHIDCERTKCHICVLRLCINVPKVMSIDPVTRI
jgi:hypothetical protein